MSISDILNTATSGLHAAQAGLRSVSNNVANAGVAGYAREELRPETRVVAGRVSGVRVGEPERVANAFLERNLYRRAGEAAQAETLGGYLDRLQSSLGAPGAEGSLPERLNAITAAATAMTAVRVSPETNAKFLGQVDDAFRTMRGLDADAGRMGAEADAEVAATADRANMLLARIHDLNGAIATSTGTGHAGSENARAAALGELSELLAITVRENGNGAVTVETAGGAVLLDTRLRRIGGGSAGGLSTGAGPLTISDGDRVEAVLSGAGVGGRFGALTQVRDVEIPRFRDELASLSAGVAEALNGAANAGTPVPPPQRLEGRNTGLVGSDALRFTGNATIAVTTASGDSVRAVTLDLSGIATVDDLMGAINTGLAGDGTASFANGRLVITTGPGRGVALAEGTPPSARGGVGLSHFFGLNDLVSDPSAAAGLSAGDPHGWGAGESVALTVRDASGRLLGQATLTGAGGTIGDVLAEANAGPLGAWGSFGLDSRGRLAFQPSLPDARLGVAGDSTNRFGTGQSFSALLDLPGGNVAGAVRPDLLANPARLPLARLEAGPPGTRVLGAADRRGALALADALGGSERAVSAFVGRVGLGAANAADAAAQATAVRADAAARRDGFSGVNVDEELAQMVVLQNSYGAAARVITAASQMYDTLVGMVR